MEADGEAARERHREGRRAGGAEGAHVLRQARPQVGLDLRQQLEIDEPLGLAEQEAHPLRQRRPPAQLVAVGPADRLRFAPRAEARQRGVERRGGEPERGGGTSLLAARRA